MAMSVANVNKSSKKGKKRGTASSKQATASKKTGIKLSKSSPATTTALNQPIHDDWG